MTCAVVVGATGALGRPIAERLAARGLEVIGVARTERALAELDFASRTCAVDIASPEAAEQLASTIGHDEVQIAVHAAAAPMSGPVMDVEREAVMQAVRVKVLGLLALVRGVRAGLRPDGRLVAIGGSLGYDPTPDGTTAGIANAGQANLVRQLSRALAPDGITCHVVSPGPVETKRLRALAAGEAERRATSVDHVLGEMRAGAPLGRLTTPDEVAWAVAALADPEARALAGSALLLDGGRRTAMP